MWLAASRVYARTLVAEVAAAPHTAHLFPAERQALERLGLLPDEPPPTSTLSKAASWTVGRPAKVAVLVGTSLVLIIVVFQFFVAQFFNYLPGAHWLNHPLVLLPVIRHIPPGLAP